MSSILSVRDVSAHDFIRAYAAHLKKSGQIEVPKWADYAKTAVYRELSPEDPDWYFTRIAAVARKVYLHKGVGIGQLRRQFGGSRHVGTRKPRFQRAIGGVIRHAMQDLEKIGVLEQNSTGCVPAARGAAETVRSPHLRSPRRSGRAITPKGQKDLDTVARQLIKAD